MRFINRCPGICVQFPIQPVDNQLALRQSQNCRRQFFHRRKRSCCSRGNDSFCRRMLPPYMALPANKLVAPKTRIAQTALFENFRPIPGDNFQKLQRFLPMGGIFLRHQLRQIGKIQIFIMNGIYQPRQFLSQKTSLISTTSFPTRNRLVWCNLEAKLRI